MEIKSIHPNFIMPIKATDKAGAFDIYMPEFGTVNGNTQFFNLGFATAVPDGHVALLLPRSSAAKSGLELTNTCGVIDSDYRGEWKAALRSKNGYMLSWNTHDRLLQFMIVPIANITLKQVYELDTTVRGLGGFGSTGN